MSHNFAHTFRHTVSRSESQFQLHAAISLRVTEIFRNSSPFQLSKNLQSMEKSLNPEDTLPNIPTHFHTNFNVRRKFEVYQCPTNIDVPCHTKYNSPRNHCRSPIKTAPIVLQKIATAATDSNSADFLESLDSTIFPHLRKSATMLHKAHAVLQSSTKTCIIEMQGKYPRQSLRTSAFLRGRCCGSIEVSAASRFRPFKIHTTRPLSSSVRYSAKILFLRSFLQREIDETVILLGENVS